MKPGEASDSRLSRIHPGLACAVIGIAMLRTEQGRSPSTGRLCRRVWHSDKNNPVERHRHPQSVNESFLQIRRIPKFIGGHSLFDLQLIEGSTANRSRGEPSCLLSPRSCSGRSPALRETGAADIRTVFSALILSRFPSACAASGKRTAAEIEIHINFNALMEILCENFSIFIPLFYFLFPWLQQPDRDPTDM